jgi:predicted PurR-regulated permease PerM
MGIPRLWVCILVPVIFIYLLQSILAPFLFAALFAYLGDPLVDWLETRRLSRTLSVVIVFSVLCIIIFCGFLLLLPVLGDQLHYLQDRIPLMLAWVQEKALPWLQVKFSIDTAFIKTHLLNDEVSRSLLKSSAWLGDFFAQLTRSGLVFLGVMGQVILVPVVAFYFLRDWDRMVEKVANLIPRRYLESVSSFVKEADAVVGSFFKGQLLVMFCLAVVYTGGLWLMGLRLAFLIGILAGLASIVPYLGFAVGLIAAVVAAFFQFYDVQHMAYAVGVFVVGQFLESVLFTPLLIGDRIGLHPVVVIFAIMAGGQLFGATGMLLALPGTAILAVGFRAMQGRYLKSDWYHQ